MKRGGIVFVLISISFGWTGCAQPPATATVAPTVPPPTATASRVPPTVASQPVAIRTPTASAQSVVWAKWQSGPHGNTYGLDKGPNTYCSRCHSPQNWDPASKV